MSTNGALTRLTSISARRAVNFGSQMSTCDRMCRMPCETCHSIALVARRTTSSSVSSAFLSDQHSIPSNSVPLSFHLGSPAVSVVSRWTCDSTNGGVTKHPAASMVSRASAGNPGWMSTNKPSRTPMSVSSPFAESLALWTIRSSIVVSLRPQPSCQYLRPCAALGHGQRVQPKLPTEDSQNPWSAESSLASSHARPGAELQSVYCACIHRPVGARTVDGLKFRTRAGMGRCQGGFCGPRVLEILCRELGLDPLSVTKCGTGSEILAGRLRPEGEGDA